MLSYTTSPGTAKEYSDYYREAGTLVFQHDQNQQTITITIEQDDLPEGPELFYLNLTSARLNIPR